MSETSKIYYMKEGDRLPKLQMTFLDDDGNPISLAQIDTIKLYIAPSVGGRRIVDGGTMAVVGQETDGTAEYAWEAGDTDKPGEYKVEVVLTQDELGTELKQTVPRSNYDTLIITPRL
jgi:hypothetical protein